MKEIVPNKEIVPMKEIVPNEGDCVLCVNCWCGIIYVCLSVSSYK